MHAADPEVSETIKRSNRPYFALQGNICALPGAKDHLTIFLYDPLVPDPEGLINQGRGNRTARAIQVRQGDTLNERALADLFRAIIARDRAGGVSCRGVQALRRVVTSRGGGAASVRATPRRRPSDARCVPVPLFCSL